MKELVQRAIRVCLARIILQVLGLPLRMSSLKIMIRGDLTKRPEKRIECRDSLPFAARVWLCGLLS